MQQRIEERYLRQSAIHLGVLTFELTARLRYTGLFSLCDQLEQGVLAVSNQIAQGLVQGGLEVLRSSLQGARGSLGKVQSMLCMLERMFCSNELGLEVAQVKSSTVSLLKRIDNAIALLEPPDPDPRRSQDDGGPLIRRNFSGKRARVGRTTRDRDLTGAQAGSGEGTCL